MQVWEFGSPLISSLPFSNFEEIVASENTSSSYGTKKSSHGIENGICPASIQQLNLYPQYIKNCYKSIRKTTTKKDLKDHTAKEDSQEVGN